VTHLQSDFCMIHTLNPVAIKSVIHSDENVLIRQFYAVKQFTNTVVPPYSRVISSKTNRGCVKLRIISNAIYNVIFV
jgi:hypothetical protein